MQIGVKIAGEKMTWEEAFRRAQDPLRPWQWTPDVLDLMRVDYDDPDREPGVESFTPTRIMNCHRQSVLMEGLDYYTDADLIYPTVRGHMVHALMERARYPGALKTLRERRFRLEVPTSYGPQLFTAKPDLLVVKSITDIGNGPPTVSNLHDAQATALIKVVDYKSKNGIKHELTEPSYEHQLQVNMYGWMASQNPSVYDDAGKLLGRLTKVLGLDDDIKLEVDELEIVYVDMAKVRTFSSKGWRLDRGKRLTRTPPYEYETLNLAPIRLWSPPKVGAFVAKRIEERLRAKEVLPDCEYDNTEKAYLCAYCPVSEHCRNSGAASLMAARLAKSKPKPKAKAKGAA